MSEQGDNTRADGKPKESISEIVRTVLYALLIALTFKTVLFQPFQIPSASMKSTLLIGDYLFVSKYSYGYSRFSLPLGSWIPESVFPGRIFSSEPERGDVIVFRQPNDITQDFIKRVVGLPGDTVEMREGVLFINGRPVEMEPIDDFREPVAGASQVCSARIGSVCAKRAFQETLPNGVSYTVLDALPRSATDSTRVFTVQEDMYFFVGDNRDNSEDSRSRLGFVPRANIVGRAEVILFSSSGSFWEIWNWRGDRFFKSIN